MTDKSAKLSDEIMKRKALARWENEGGSPSPEKTAEPQPVCSPVKRRQPVRKMESCD
ncbi:MAG: hypothetical protein K0R63_452 [Rickettsiales bacterium]|jgi:hypothetical protein|nr:hypothetical protein [Rickettsiales bacterium]